jgi:hypothetical protein
MKSTKDTNEYPNDQGRSFEAHKSQLQRLVLIELE